MSQDDRLMDTIPALRVGLAASEVIRGIVKKQRRTISDVARALLERGVAAYLRDGLLFEPDVSEADAEERPDEISVRTITLKDKKARKKNTA